MEWLYGLVAGAAAFAVAVWRAYSAGRRKAEEVAEHRRQVEYSQTVEAELDKVRKAQEVQHEVAARTDDDVARRLRDDWTRD